MTLCDTDRSRASKTESVQKESEKWFILHVLLCQGALLPPHITHYMTLLER